jgi:hypothetical protein
VGGAIDYAGVSAIHRELASPVRLDEDGVYYFSFLFRRDGDDPAPPNTFSLTLRNPQQTEPQKRLVVGVARSNHVVFTHFEGGGARAAFPLAYDRTYLIVGKIVAGHTRPDQVFLRVYRPEQPVDRREPASWSVASRPVRSDVTLNVLTISVDSQSRQMIDEIRIGATWGSVTSAGSGLPASHASRPPGLDEQVE